MLHPLGSLTHIKMTEFTTVLTFNMQEKLAWPVSELLHIFRMEFSHKLL